jgi:hypothetical protein
MASRWLMMCAVVQALFATSAAWSEPISPATGNRSGSVVTEGVVSSGRTAPSTSVPMPTPSVRTTIARFLEGVQRFRKYDDEGAPKLVKARIAGPVEVTRMFSDKHLIYCVEADLIMTNRVLWVTHDVLQAVIKFLPGENGGQRIQAQVRSVDRLHTVCNQVPFTPFPELEQLRTQRRHALGKADS